jgi:CBS domain-containing protein
VTEARGDSLRAAAARMWRQQTGSLVVTEGGRLAGIITERDVLRAVALGADPDKSSVDDVMTAEVFTVPPDTDLQDAARQMAARWIRHLPVLDGDEIVGVVGMRDMTGVFAAMAPGSVAVEHEFDLLVRQRRLARIERGDLD